MEAQSEIACEEGTTGDALPAFSRQSATSTQQRGQLQDEEATAPLCVRGGGGDEVTQPGLEVQCRV